MVAKNLFTVNRTFNSVKQSSKYTSIVIRKHGIWTQDRVIKSPYKDVEIPNITLHDFVWQNLDKWPEKTVSVCGVTGRKYTYEQAFKLSRRFAANLRTKFKITDGDTVGVMLPNVPEYPMITLGILAAGGVIASLSPIYTVDEIKCLLKMSDTKMVVTLPEIVPNIKEALKISKMNITIVVVKTGENGSPAPEETVLFNELIEDIHTDESVLKQVRRNVDDICFLPYSSGTTGLPKVVELTHRNIIANCTQISNPLIKMHHETTPSHQDAAIGVLPFCHIFATTFLLFYNMFVGLKLVALEKFEPELFLRTIEKYKTNILLTVPPLIRLMGLHPVATEKTFESVEFVGCGAAAVAASDVERFINRTKRVIDFRQGYGLTETSPIVTLSPKGCRYEAAGVPVANTEIRIVDKALKNLGPNETGEILIRGPQVMRGYRDNLKANKETFTDDGWFRSGDLAVSDEEGIITIAERLKEIIEVKGQQVRSVELESLLREHPSVNEAAVLGVPHQIKGETPRAFVVLKEGQKCNEKQLREFINEKVPAYKRVDDITYIDIMPKTPSGKILKRVLKEKYC